MRMLGLFRHHRMVSLTTAAAFRRALPDRQKLSRQKAAAGLLPWLAQHGPTQSEYENTRNEQCSPICIEKAWVNMSVDHVHGLIFTAQLQCSVKKNADQVDQEGRASNYAYPT